MVIQVNEDRNIIKDDDVYCTQNENNATNIEFTFPEKYQDFDKKLVFRGDDGSIVENIENDEYSIPDTVTSKRNVSFYVWLTNGDTTQDFRTKTYSINFFKNENATEQLPAETPITA